jgi:hypothetical protein
MAALLQFQSYQASDLKFFAAALSQCANPTSTLAESESVQFCLALVLPIHTLSMLLQGMK